MSQPEQRDCTVSMPVKLDADLKEFWVGNPWEIAKHENLSSFERNRVFLNIQGRDFIDVSFLTGADNDADSRSIVPADFNGDGMLDLALRSAGADGNGVLQLFENRFPKQNYLQVALRGDVSNRLGIGARIIAHVGDKQYTRELYPHDTFRCQSPSVVHFGLGNAKNVNRLSIHWPSGDVNEVQTINNVPANQFIVVEEGRNGYDVVRRGESMVPIKRPQRD